MPDVYFVLELVRQFLCIRSVAMTVAECGQVVLQRPIVVVPPRRHGERKVPHGLVATRLDRFQERRSVADRLVLAVPERCAFGGWLSTATMRDDELCASTRVWAPVPQPMSSMRVTGPIPGSSPRARRVLAAVPGPCRGSPLNSSKNSAVIRSDAMFPFVSGLPVAAGKLSRQGARSRSRYEEVCDGPAPSLAT